MRQLKIETLCQGLGAAASSATLCTNLLSSDNFVFGGLCSNLEGFVQAIIALQLQEQPEVCLEAHGMQ